MLINQLEQFDNCLKHGVTAVLTDALFLSQPTVETRRSYLFGSDYTLEVSVIFPFIDSLQHTTRGLRDQASQKGVLLRQRQDIPQASIIRFVARPHRLGKLSAHIDIMELVNIEKKPFACTTLRKAPLQCSSFKRLVSHSRTKIMVTSGKSYRNQPKDSDTVQLFLQSRTKGIIEATGSTAQSPIMGKRLCLRVHALISRDNGASTFSFARAQPSPANARRQSGTNKQAPPYSAALMKQTKDVIVNFYIVVSSSM